MNLEIDCLEKQEVRKTSESPNESELWREFKRGNRDALGQIFKIYYQPLSVYGKNIYPDPDFINDCIQEMFLRFWEYRQTLGDVIFVKFYLIKCFRRHVVRKLENLKKETKSLKSNYDQIIATSEETELALKQIEELRIIKVANEIKGLSRRQQEVVFLKFYQNLSHDEICSIMALNYQSVKNLIHKSVKTLRERLVA